jgi:outer membrane protein assembly factor BamB
VNVVNATADTPWRWDASDSLATCEKAALKEGYAIKKEFDKEGFGTIEISRVGGKVIYQWKGHYRSKFLVRDGMLYAAIFHPFDEGVSIRAVNLENGRVAWSTKLPQAFPTIGGKYHTWVNMEFKDGRIYVYSEQSFEAGRFWWVLDRNGAILEKHPD